MEPMALGSPPSPTNNYLPSFLMGDTASPANQSINMVSPSRNKSMNLSYRGSSAGDCKNLRQKLFKDAAESPYNSFASPNIEKGPPKQGLFDTLEVKKTRSPLLSSTMHPMAEHPTFTPNESFSRIGNDSLNVSQCLQVDNLNNSDVFHRTNAQKQRSQVTHWVTVFGFPPSTASVALSHFTNCGHIVDKKFPTQGNYAHIKFSNPYEVNKALGMNGRIIMNNVMVGVMPYYPDSNDNKENSVSHIAADLTSPIRARSLRHSFISPPINASMTQSPNVPQKSTGIVTKAMEYVFGW